MRSWMKVWGAVLALAMAMGGCGDDDNGGGGGGGGGLSPKVEKAITAAEGGTVENGNAKITIPAGALPADTTISIEEIAKSGLPNAADIAGEVWSFGPEGLMFEMPVTLTLKAADVADVPEGKKAVIAFLNEETDKWEALDNQAINGTSISGDTDHFSTFALVFVDGEQVGGGCEGEYDACGGNLVGTWTLGESCANFESDVFAQQFDVPNCEDDTVALGVNVTGSATFGQDGTFESEFTFALEATVTVPKSCFNGTCPEMEDEDDLAWTESGNNCVGTTTMMDDEPDVTTGTYEVDGGSLTITNTSDDGGDDDGPDTLEFCVDGDNLSVRQIMDGVEIRWSATR